MKIGIVSNLYPPQARGGAEMVAQRIADALYERGHNVFVLTTEPFSGMASLFPRIKTRYLGAIYRFFPCNVYYLGSNRTFSFPIRLLWHFIDLFSPCAKRSIRYIINEENPDLIITHNLKGLGVSTGRQIQKKGVPHIHTLHDIQLSVPSGLLIYGKEDEWLNRSMLRYWYERGVQRSIGKPDLVLSPSKFLAEFYKDRAMFCDSDIQVLPNPLPQTNIKPRTERVPGSTRFLYVGQLEPHKGIMLMLDALEELGDDIQLHVAGDGSLADYVDERSKRDSRIHFHGFVSLEHVMRILQSTDAVLVPSLCYENSPTVIYEAFQIGVPVIASKIGGIPELVEHEVNGLLVEPANQSALASAMKQFAHDRDKWWGLTDAIHKHAQKYTIEKYVNRLEELMSKVVRIFE